MEVLKGANIVGSVSFQEPLKKDSDENKEKSIAWIKDVVNNLKNLEKFTDVIENGTV